jgi:hypothetical protein
VGDGVGLYSFIELDTIKKGKRCLRRDNHVCCKHDLVDEACFEDKLTFGFGEVHLPVE